MKAIFLLLTLTLATSSAVSCNDEYEIKAEDDLETLRYCPNSLFRLKSDIVMNKVFTPINSFYGVIQGENHKVTNVTINSHGYAVGFFRIFKGVISNLTLEVNIRSIKEDTVLIGGFAGYLTANDIINVRVTARITGGTEYCKGCTRKIIGGFCGATTQFPNNLTVNSTIQVALMDAYVGGVAGIVGIQQDTFPVSTMEKVVTNITANSSIRCLHSSCYAGAIFGMTYQSITNSSFTGSIRISGTKTKNCVIGGAVGFLVASLSNVRGELSELYVTTCGLNATNYVGGLIGYGHTVAYDAIQIDSCSINIATLQSDYTIDYTGGFIGLAQNLLISRSTTNVTNLNSCLHTGGIAGKTNVVKFIQCMVTVGNHMRADCELSPLTASTQNKNIFFGGVIGTSIADSIINQTIVNFTSIGGNYTAKFVFGGLIGSGSNVFVNSTAAAYGQTNLSASVTRNSSIAFGSLAGLVLLERDHITTIQNSYAVFGTLNLTLACLEFDNAGIMGGLVAGISQGYDTIRSNITVRSSYAVINASLYSNTSCLSSSTLLCGSLFGTSYSDIYFYNVYVQFNLLMQMVKFKDFSPSGPAAYGVGSLLGKTLMSHTSIVGAVVNMTVGLLKIGTAAVISIPLYAGINKFTNCLMCNYIYIVQNAYILSNEFTISRAMSTVQDTYAFGFSEIGEWMFQNNRPLLRAVPNYILTSVNVGQNGHVTWVGNLILATKIAQAGWDCDYTFKCSKVRSNIPLLSFSYLENACYVDQCRYCDSTNPNKCLSCAMSHYVVINKLTCEPCPRVCALCGNIYPYPLIQAPVLCVTCPHGSLVPVLTNNFVKPVECVPYPTCKVPRCLRCVANNVSACMYCSLGYYKNIQKYCVPCPDYCPMCTSSSNCLLCRDYSHIPIIGLCVYDVLDDKASNFCTVSIKDNPNLCISCRSKDTGQTYRPDDNWVCKIYEETCRVTGCFSCITSNPMACKICQGGYVLNEKTKKCDRCEAGCKTCLTPFNCLDCLNGYTLMNGTCIVTTNCTSKLCQYCDRYSPVYCFKCFEPYSVTPGYGLCTYLGTDPSKNKVAISLISIFCVLGVAAVIIVPIVIFYLKRRNAVKTVYDEQRYVDEVLST